MENFKEFIKLHNSSAEIWEDKIILKNFSIEAHDFQIVLGKLTESMLRLTLIDVKNSLYSLFIDEKYFKKIDSKVNVHLIKDFDISKYQNYINQKILNASAKAYEILENAIKESKMYDILFSDDNKVYLINSFEKFKEFFDCESYNLYHKPFYIFIKLRKEFVQVEIAPKPNDPYSNSSKSLSVKGTFVPDSTIDKEIQSIYYKWLLKNLNIRDN